MQRYRVNYRLLIGLVVGLLVAAPASYGLWKFQVGRNAGRLLDRAETAEKSGDSVGQFESLELFTKLRPNDDEARLKLGAAAAELFNEKHLEKLNGIDQQTVQDAYYTLINTVLIPSEDESQRKQINELRRKLVDVHMLFRAPDRALQVIETLIKDGQGDAKLIAMRAQCLFNTQNVGEGVKRSYQAIGYDPTTEEFDVAKAEAPHEPSVYLILANNQAAIGQREIAKRVIDQMVLANPESREAYIFQYQFLRTINEPELARAALEKAYEIDPEDAGVLLAKGIEAQNEYQETMADKSIASVDEQRAKADEYLDEAAKYFSEGLKKYPDRIPFYEYSARIEMFRQKYDDALATVETGLKQFDLKKTNNSLGLPAAIDLELLKIDVLFAQNKLDAVKAEIKALRDLENLKVVPLADYYAAQLEMVNQNWLVAARMLKDVRPRLIGMTNLQAAAAAKQGMCHALLGQWDLADEAYAWALEKSPGLPMAVAGQQEAATHTGRRIGNSEEEANPMQFDQMVKDRLKLPKEQQKWEEVEKLIDDYVRKQAEGRGASESWVESRQALLRAQMIVTRAAGTTDAAEKKRLFKEAREAIVKANSREPNDVSIQLAAPRVVMLDPDSGPANALELLDKIIAKNKARDVEETPPFRLLRVDLLVALNDEQLVNQLHAATAGMEAWNPQQQAMVWAAVGNRFDQLGQLADAQMCLEKAAKLAPGQLPYRVAIFELARKQADDVAMRAAQEGVLEVVKSKSDPDYVLTEVKRMMVAYAANLITKDELKQARTLLDEAIRQRSTWAELYVLSGQLAIMLEGDSAKALKDLDLALENGPTNLNALNLQIRLLAELGRFQEARDRMAKIPEEAWTSILDRTAATVLRKVGENEKAFSEARKLADANPKNAEAQVWFADIASAAKHLDEGEAALKKAVALQPANPDMWTALLNFYMINKKSAEVEETLRQAQLELDEEYLTLLTAQQHRLFGRFAQAENILKSAYKDRLDEPAVAQRMAEFYLGWADQEDSIRQEAANRGAPADKLPPAGAAHRGQAAPYLNRILRAANEDKAKQGDPTVAWARRQAARLFSLSGNYQDSLKAEAMLSAAVENNSATTEGQDLLIDILNRRGDPASRERIVELLQKIQQQRGLAADRELLLGKALNDLGDWDACQKQMEGAITRNPDDAALRVGYVEMLIDRQDFALAERWLPRLTNLPSAAQAIPQLKVRMAAAKGDKAEVRKMLTSMTPALTVLNPQQLQIVHAVGLLADSVGDHEYALQLIAEYSRRVPGNDMELAQFTALYGDLDAGLAMLEQLFPANMDQVLAIMNQVLRTRRATDAAKVDAAVNRMVSKARRDDPEAARRMVLEAESLEIQERFDDAIAAYKAILARDDVPKFVRATAINNLAFLLAMKKQDLDQALEGVNEAIEIIGPISDILDTRALVYLHRGDFADAVKDLQLAVKMGATASKYFHLAQALLGAGDQAGALAAWDKAEAKGISAKTVPGVEVDDFDQTKAKIEAVRAKLPGT